MTESTDNRALGLWDGDGIRLLKSFIGKRTLLVRATPFNESSVEFSFDLSGLDDGLGRVRKACNW